MLTFFQIARKNDGSIVLSHYISNIKKLAYCGLFDWDNKGATIIGLFIVRVHQKSRSAIGTFLPLNTFLLTCFGKYGILHS